jgi:acyl-coenzyme A synthetase/AMP-(fatty) acid ligase
VDRLPRNAMGKIVKEEVRAMVLQETAEKNQQAAG